MRIWTRALVARRGWLGLAFGLALGMGLPGAGAADPVVNVNDPVFTLPDGSTTDQRGDPWAGMQKAVPEPSALLLFAAGAGVVAHGARRRRS